jgi:hypothetical protein
LLKVVEALVEEVEYSLDEERFSVARLIHLALAGLEDVAFHFFHHFKALYRLAHYFHTSEKSKNPQKVNQVRGFCCNYCLPKDRYRTVQCTQTKRGYRKRPVLRK